MHVEKYVQRILKVQDRRPHFPSENHNVKDQSAFSGVQTPDFRATFPPFALGQGKKSTAGPFFQSRKNSPAARLRGL